MYAVGGTLHHGIIQLPGPELPFLAAAEMERLCLVFLFLLQVESIQHLSINHIDRKIHHTLALRGGFSGRDISIPERERLDEFRKLVKAQFLAVSAKSPDLFTDERLMRFLRNNNLDVQNALCAFDRMILWRHKLGLEKISSDVKKHWREGFWDMACIPKRDVFYKYYKFNPSVSVSEGELVSIELTGRIRIREFVAKITETDFFLFFCYLMEWSLIKLSHLSRETKKLSRMIQIKNLEGISVFQASSKKGMDIFGKVNKMLHEVYPETLSRLVIIHAPPIFGILWRMFRGIIPMRTRGKMEIYSSSEKSRSVLFKLTGLSECGQAVAAVEAAESSRSGLLSWLSRRFT